MGIYLNKGNGMLREALNGQIYVDKSMLIRVCNSKIKTPDKFMAVSRPRRFGKSMAANMLVAYYSKGCDSKELFSSLKISKDESFEKHLNKYNVLHLTMTEFTEYGVDKAFDYIKAVLLDDIEEEYPDIKINSAFSLDLIFGKLYQKTQIPFIFIIDEWDAFMRAEGRSESEKRQYLDFLRNLLKDREYVALCYMTGILPIKKYGEHSAINMFTEYSMEHQWDLAEFTGFTEQEVEELCAKNAMSFEKIKNWYNGYVLKIPDLEKRTPERDVYKGIRIYNPCSVVKAMQFNDIRNYWSKTETFKALKAPINMNLEGLKEAIELMMAGENIPVDMRIFQNDFALVDSAQAALGMLVHLGYLSFDCEFKTAHVPNLEVNEEFVTCIKDEPKWAPVMNAINLSEKCLKATLAGDGETIAQIIEKVHRENTSIIKYNDENSLSCIVGLSYFTAKNRYHILREYPAGNGYADLVFIPRKTESLPAIVVELKRDKDASIAIDQIKSKKYSESLEEYSGEIILVGVNYISDTKDENYKKHSCKIERMVK